MIADARYTPDPDRLRNAVRAQGMMCGIWEPYVDYGSPARVADGYDFYVGQIEGPYQYDRVAKSVAGFRSAHPTMPAAVVTNFGGLETAELAKPLIDAGFGCITETWIKTDGVPPEARVTYAERALGWPWPQPMAGLGENGAVLGDYPTITGYPRYSVFAAEMLLR